MATVSASDNGNGTSAGSATPLDLLARLAEVPADRIAVVAGDRELTFGELRAEATRIARRLGGLGIGPESVVALCLPRGADLVATLIGTLTAGAAYLPVDPRLPAERRRYLVEDSAADLVVVDTGVTFHAEAPGHLTAGELAAPDGTEAAYRPVAVDAGRLAYVIYTSGSTGRPKGVEVSRGSAAALLAELESAEIARTVAGRVGWNASPSFDASVQQWVRLCRGDTLVMIDEETRSDPALLAAMIEEHGLTDLDITPSHAEPLLEHLAARGDGDDPLTLLVGGEAISPALWRRVADLVEEGVVRAVNLYGPTECTVDATAGWVTGDRPHIGTVLPGLSVRLLDNDLLPVADGGSGELYLAGPRVARGYRRRPALTSERFVADLSGDGGARMYRTGDLCRRLPDGRLEYLGRADGQIKLRGHRIELYEIEAAVAGHPAVAEAAVVLREDVNGAPGLVAYYRAQQAIGAEELRSRLASVLPGYMVPAAFVEVERFATTPSGKLDRTVLPAPAAVSPAGETAAGTAADEPTGPVEELIARVWSHVLGAPRIGADDNFFKLGGHSLLAIKLVAGVRKELGLSLPVKTVYANPRLRDLARQIESLLDVQESGPRPVPALV
ncbi:non-ribosomal peptide synthetase [Streptomyces sp. AK02-01A]|uniref:non-ribosomal peptide synthetase n=1 Tax=Streptomyces sp. AK02-01A TaxID=3028648 RepID=UPI0029A28655|nr:non-ribosomal peptide synthetase [Streptomyces sp. AK02-01A]MDX3855889.1 non-ribosomal peptide synthetase [Streptomyces sp. AK02-01A]